MKDALRKILLDLNIPITENLRNDILLKKIIKKSLHVNDNAIDVGCHKGEILNLFLKYAPNGNHYAIEPIPYLSKRLKEKFKQVRVFSCALAEESGQKEFYWIKDNPAYSGLNKRKFSDNSAIVNPIVVEVRRLDDIIPENVKISFIKIDVEGAELKVLKGAENIIKRDKPKIAFEFGLGGSNYYNTSATDIFLFFTRKGYLLYDYESYLNGGEAYNEEKFNQIYRENIIYNFIAIPRKD